MGSGALMILAETPTWMPLGQNLPSLAISAPRRQSF